MHERKKNASKKKAENPPRKCVAAASSWTKRQKNIEPESEDEASNDGRKGVKTQSSHKQEKSVLSLLASSDDYQPKRGSAKGARAPHVPSKPAPGRKNLFFSSGEDNAIKKGVKGVGHGKWSSIKQNYSVALEDLSAVQIKDRARTLELK